MLGARLVGARRVRLAATLTVLGVSVAFILLMLALASELSALETDPSALGKRYQLTASLPASAAARVRRLPGVAAAAPRYEVQAIDSFSLGETIDVIAYPGDHTVFEAPPLVAGGRLRGARQAEVGNGLAQVLGLSVGSTLALELPSGREARFRCRASSTRSSTTGASPTSPPPRCSRPNRPPPSRSPCACGPAPNASAVSAELKALGATSTPASGAVGQGRSLIAALTAILRAVAIVDGFVCLYTLVQALALTARERRATIAVLRACGAGVGGGALLLAGAAVAVVVPAAVLGGLLERFVLGPAMARLAVSYASLGTRRRARRGRGRGRRARAPRGRRRAVGRAPRQRASRSWRRSADDPARARRSRGRTRREALAELGLGAAALMLAGCGAGAGRERRRPTARRSPRPTSTRAATACSRSAPARR